MRPSRAIGTAAIVGLVPATIWLAYRGHRAGLYPYDAIPLVFGGYLATSLVVLFALLPRVRRRYG